MWNRMISRSVARSLASVVFVAGIAYSGAAKADPSPADPFDGEWSVKATPDSKSQDNGQGAFDEAVLFHDGQFSAAVFAMFGFTPAQYTVSFDSGHAEFSATLASSDRGTLTWTGHETQTGMEGSLVWDKPDGESARYELTGTREEP